MRTRVAAAIVWALSAALTASPQNSRTESRPVTVLGQVIDAMSGTPISNARVTAPAGAVDPYIALTDSMGRFSLNATTSLRDLQVRKGGYALEPVVLPPDLSKPLEIRLFKSASIAGRAVDSDGEPLTGVRVSISRNGQSFSTADTDDRGAYRIGGLGSGVYAVSIQHPRLPREQIYFPGGDAAAAERITLRPGDERTGVDFTLPVPAPTEAASRLSGTGTVRGRVVDTYGQPISRAVVNLSIGRGVIANLVRTVNVSALRTFMQETDRILERESRVTWSDSEGRFEFRDLPDGDAIVFAAKDGYMRAPEPIAIARLKLTSGEIREGIELWLDRWASIEGRIWDERGEPVEGASIQVLQTDYQNGLRTLKPWNQTPYGSARAPIYTDERGHYRVFGLPPGQYVVAATPKDRTGRESFVYAPTLFPGTVDARAAHVINVIAGATIANIDVTIAAVRTAKVTGRALERDGTPRAGGTLLLTPDQGGVQRSTLAGIGPDGSFEFANVMPGRYVVQTFGSLNPDPATETEFGAVPVTVDENDVEGVIVQTLRASSIKGTISFDAPPNIARPSVAALQVMAVPDDSVVTASDLATSKINPSNLTFALGGVTGSRRLIATNLPSGWGMATVRLNGSSIGHETIQFSGEALSGVEIVLTNRVGTITGQVTDLNSVGLSQASIVAFATDPQLWYPRSPYVRVAGTDSGRFSLVDLPEGRYFVSVEPRMNIGDGRLRDPEYLSTVSGRSTTVVVTREVPVNVALEEPR